MFISDWEEEGNDDVILYILIAVIVVLAVSCIACTVMWYMAKRRMKNKISSKGAAVELAESYDTSK